MPKFAQVPNNTISAPGIASRASVTSVQNEPVMSVLFEFVIHDPLEFVLNLAHVFAGSETRAIGDPIDVRVHRDGGHAECGIENHVGSLTTNPW